MPSKKIVGSGKASNNRNARNKSITLKSGTRPSNGLNAVEYKVTQMPKGKSL